MNTNIPKEWLLKALDMEVGRELWVPCISKKDQTRILNILERDRLALSGYFPVQASQVVVSRDNRGKEFFVKLSKEPSGNPLYAWEKYIEIDSEGNTIIKADIHKLIIDPIQLRRMTQMKEDGLGLSDIAKYEGITIEHVQILLEYAKTGKYKIITPGRPKKYG